MGGSGLRSPELRWKLFRRLQQIAVAADGDGIVNRLIELPTVLLCAPCLNRKVGNEDDGEIFQH